MPTAISSKTISREPGNQRDVVQHVLSILERQRPKAAPPRNQVTCGPFNACSSVSVTIRTYARGPPELISAGTTISDLFIDSQEASEPRNIIMMPKSSTMTRLQWEEPTSLEGTLDVYKVKVCKSFITCKQKQSVSGCLEYEASHAWLDISSIPDTKYCVVITAITRCGRNFKTSLPSTQEIQTPLFALPDVSDLAVEGIKSGYVALSWQRPTGRFDYYSIQNPAATKVRQWVVAGRAVPQMSVEGDGPHQRSSLDVAQDLARDGVIACLNSWRTILAKDATAG
ncbi:hypothetical protein HPB51_005927 [Rhipicephalus microplus]|uniref:Fibronectin type-III domain-containing protein n=1 Tax=Rhipicephalus microplus TaxID=6941 RepID=A0A9J6E768_RHIMP|nr:hypothetical protein HPB51_005927 [Rhipicephalus microplus]